MNTTTHLRALALTTTAAVALSACGNSTSSTGSSKTSTPSSTTATAPVGSNEKETATVNPRVLLSHDQGLTLLDAETGKTLKETKKPGFLRLSNAGDGRHVMVSDADVFRVFDMGISSQPHGDHKHNYTYEPGLAERTFAAPKAGHVVPHAGKVSLFSDGAGTIQTLDADQVGSKTVEPHTAKTKAPHHGVAIALPDGTMVHTEGTKDARKSIVATKNGKEIARTDDCEGVHGEAAPHSEGDDVAVFGCESGPVVYRDGDFHKVKVSGYVRNGNLAGSHESPIVLGDHKTKKIDDENAEAEHPTKVALIDSRNDSLTTVELGSSYWFRSLARGPEGEGLVLTYDGKVNVIDVETGKVTKRIDAIKPWKEKADWQEPGPAIKVAGDKAYVTDAENKELVVIDLESGKVAKRISLANTPVEMAVVDDVAEAPAHKEAHEGHAH